MRESIKYPVTRHLEDDDNLFENRDGTLIPGQEAKAKEIASSLYCEVINHDVPIMVFISSPKKRAVETAALVSNELRPRLEDTRIILSTDESLRDQNQGEIILPKDYKPGDHFDGLSIAGKIFQKETFNDEEPSQDNITYRFGDSLKQADGSYKYPELREYFSSSGESYKDVMIRLLKGLISVSKSIERFENKKVLPVIFTHSQVKQIYIDLETIAKQYAAGEIKYEKGTLGRKCWEMYKTRKVLNLETSTVDYLSVNELLNSDIINFLDSEIEYLEKL